MAKNPARKFDNTHLSLDQAERRGFIHRDYIAHCLRWSHIAQAAHKSFATNRYLDIGCGKDLPLARLLFTNKMAPREGYYLGVDINKLPMHEAFKTASWQPTLVGQTDILDFKADEDGYLSHDKTGFGFMPPTHIVCLEMLEHVQPAYARGVIEFIANLLRKGGGTAFISTPCYDPRVGAADNHINEMTYHALGAIFEDCGLEIVGHWGTFASQRDYKASMEQDPAILSVFNELKLYYDSNLLATIFAPLYPKFSRNVLWELKAADKKPYRLFSPLAEQVEPWSSSPDYKQLLGDSHE